MTDVLVPAEVTTLEPFVAAGVLGAAEVHTAASLAGADPAAPAEVLLGAALAVRAPLHGSVCVDLPAVRRTVVAGAADPDRAAGSETSGAHAGGTAAPADPAGTHGDPGADLDALPWPELAPWRAALAGSPLVREVGPSDGPDRGDAQGRLRPLVLDGDRLYLARHWALERYVAADLLQRAGTPSPGADGGADAIRAVFAAAATADGAEPDPGQLAAALAVVDHRLVVISGGPGTGKTTTVARLLAGLAGAGGPATRVALAAPTGKAAARMTEALRGAVAALGEAVAPEVRDALAGLEATTVHRLLGVRPGGGYRHGPGSPLPHGLVVVDEASMVSLSLMAHLLAAVPPEATVVLVGDPHQLASVEAGSVLGDVVGRRAEVEGTGAAPVAPAGVAPSVRTLSVVHRQQEGSAILDLAAAVREGRADDALALLRTGGGDVSWVDTGGVGDLLTPSTPLLAPVSDAVEADAEVLVRAARAGDVEAALDALGRTKVLCALRGGRTGVEGWNRHVEARLRSAGLAGLSPWYEGRPVMVTRNDPANGVVNGDVGVAVRKGEGYEVCFPRTGTEHRVDAVRLDRVVTQWAMSIHKSQGSEVPHAVVVLPPPPARILTRELLYTAVTRAEERLTLVASEEAVRAAVDRPIARASGLAARLATPPT